MSTAHSPADAAFLERLRALPAGPARDDAALALTLAHFRAESGTLHRLAGGLLELRAHSAGMPPPVLEIIRRIPIGKGMAGLAVERKAPVTACNLQTDTSGDVRPGAKATGLQGSIVVPMLRAAEVVGALGIANRAERIFSEPEVALLLATGRILAE
ncbi:MAG: GAF domain-containing protein [Planctomycetes bacterium]|nr:GAF domain-containing protein [Planctomycetota bacterium]